jgi:flagellar motor switch protein FliN/FliY
MAEQDPVAPQGAEQTGGGGEPAPADARGPEKDPVSTTGEALDDAMSKAEELESAAAGTPPPEGVEARGEAAVKAAKDALSMAQAANGKDGSPVDLPAFEGGTGAAPAGDLNLLSDVNLHVKIELGRTRMLVEDVLRLGEGSVVELDKLAGDPVDVYVNERHVARGEVLVVNDNFCVRISEILAQNTDD